jgi:L-threonylcarbamoyladenylate synthase
MKTRFLTTSGSSKMRNVRAAARLICNGQLVAFPTETVYGLGASAYNAGAVREIFRVKGRPLDNPLIVHLWSLDQVHLLAREVPLMFWLLAREFMPGPLTLVVKKARRVPALVTAGLSTVALRMPDHPIARILLKQANVPVVAPSANLSGRPSPTAAQHVKEDLDGKVAAILDGGRCKIGVESTVLDITRRVPVILRPGGVTKEQIEEALRMKVRTARHSQNRPSSPGMKYRHYAPRAEVVLFEGEPSAIRRAMKQTMRAMSAHGIKVGVLYEERGRRAFGASRFFSLGNEGVTSAAQNLFAGFRQLDKRGVDVILCQGFPEELMGRALMNRLRKAAGRRVRVG